MSTQVEGGRPVTRFRLFGFPVHIDVSFFVIIGVFGWLSSGSNLLALLLWMVVAPVAILAHELAHAGVARTTGARPSIALAGMGGLTTFDPPRPMSRARSIAVSLAGPLLGVAIGLPLWWLWSTGPARTGPEGGPEWLYWLGLWGYWMTLGWGLLNLAPVLPLDGGQAMRELLPGDAATRARRAATISVVSGLVLAIAAWVWLQSLFLPLFFALFALTNIVSLRRERVTPVEQAPADQQVLVLLWQGQPQAARTLLEAQPAGVVPDLAVHGAVLASTGDVAQGMALLQQETARRPQDENVAALLALTHALRQDWTGLAAQLQGPGGALVPDVIVGRAAELAAAHGRGDIAAYLGTLRPDSQEGHAGPSE